jgi:pyruvate,water dikinase
LPAPEAIWSLDVDELRALDAGWRPDAAFFAARAEEQERFARYDFPDLFHRFDDLEAFRTDSARSGADNTTPRRLPGISLTTGQVIGRAWTLAEPSTTLPPGYTPETTILVARSIDAGWLPTFSRVAGVVVETGGDLSHGSILLREIGLPAITNVRRATRLLATGNRLVLRAGEGIVEVAE